MQLKLFILSVKSLLAVIGLVLLVQYADAAGPTVSNVRASQRAGTQLVDVYYDLADPDSPVLAVVVAASSNGGATYDLPAISFSGALGSNVMPGAGKHVTWNAGQDWPNMYSANVRFRVTASDDMAPTSMAFIPAGSFQMGDSLDGNAVVDFSALPVHTVNVEAFYMDKYEVTKTMWDEVYQWATNHGYSFENGAQGKANNHPVHSMTWYDAVKWCNARSEKEGRVAAYYSDAALTAVYRSGQTNVQNDWVKWNEGYRLPTEGEWEKAARGGASGRRFPWADTDNITHSRANYYSSSGSSIPSPRTTISQWTFETSVPITAGPHTAEGGVGLGRALGFHALASAYSNPVGNGSAESFNANNWSEGDYWQFHLSTAGYADIKVSFDQTRSSTGPSLFNFDYSTDGSSFTTVQASYTVLPNLEWNSTTLQSISTFEFDLSSLTPLEDAKDVYFRIIAVQDAGTVGATVRVDNFTVKGTINSVPGSYDTSSTRGYHPTFNDSIHPYTSPAGYFAANGFGLHDMAGNVCEWCWDWVEDSYYWMSPWNDPRGPESGSSRSVRDGSWDNGAFVCRTAYRNAGMPGDRYRFLGFRSVLPPPDFLIITGNPQPLIKRQGQTATFSVTAMGTVPLYFQWQKDGINIPDATASSLILRNCQRIDKGTYNVIVSNGAGTTTSLGALLRVVTAGGGEF